MDPREADPTDEPGKRQPESSDGKPICGLDLLTRRPNDPVVCEGEYCADALRKHEVLAVTSGVAKSAEETDWHPIAGRQVLICPDHDQAGFGQALLAARLCGIRRAVSAWLKKRIFFR